MRATPSIIYNYNRRVGALCSSIPALLYIIMSIPAASIDPNIMIWSIIQFIPLIIAGYYLDTIAKAKIFNVFGNREWITIILVWVILFPIARIIGIVVSDILVIGGMTYTINQLIPYFLLSLMLGAIYGFFFISAYLYLLKIALWRSRRRHG